MKKLKKLTKLKLMPEKTLSQNELITFKGGSGAGGLRTCTAEEHGGSTQQGAGTCDYLMTYEGWLYYDCSGGQGTDTCVTALQ